MRILNIPAPNFRLSDRGVEAGHATRAQIYGLKILQGFLTALGIGALFCIALSMGGGLSANVFLWQNQLLLAAATLGTLVAEKVVADVDHHGYGKSGFNPLDFGCDAALHQAWFILPAAFHRPWLGVLIVVTWAVCYPFSEE